MIVQVFNRKLVNGRVEGFRRLIFRSGRSFILRENEFKDLYDFLNEDILNRQDEEDID